MSEPLLTPVMQGATNAEKIEKLAKWLDFQFGGPQVGNQVRDIGVVLTTVTAQLQSAIRERDKNQEKIDGALEWIEQPGGVGPEDTLMFIKEVLRPT